MSDVFAEYGVDRVILIAIGVVSVLIFIKMKLLDPPTPAPQQTQKKKPKKNNSSSTSNSSAAKKKPNKASNGSSDNLSRAQRKKLNKKNAAAAAAAAAPVAAAPAPSVVSEEEEEVKVVEAPKSKKKKKKKKPTASLASDTTDAQPAAAAEPVAEATAAPSKTKKKRAKAKAKKAAAELDAARSQQEADEGWETVPTKKSSSRGNKSSSSAQVSASADADVDGETGSDSKVHLVKEDMAVETQYHGAIIGKEGCNLHALQEGTSCSIEMPKRDTGSKWVVIKGEPANVVLAKRAIKSLIEKGYCRYTHPDVTDQHISVPEKQRSTVIGRGGANIKAIQQATGAKIQMPDRDSDSNRVFVVGTLEEVKQAKSIIRELLDTGISMVTHPGCERHEVPIDMQRVGLIIGQKGQTIKSIQGNTKTKINTPNADGEPLVIIGPAAGCVQAKIEIDRILNPPEPVIPTVAELEEDKDNEWATLDNIDTEW